MLTGTYYAAHHVAIHNMYDIKINDRESFLISSLFEWFLGDF